MVSNFRSLQIQSNNRASAEIKPTARAGPAAIKEPEYPSGLNKDLCSLAQQFFTNEGANKKPSKKPVMTVKPQPQQPQPKPLVDPFPLKPVERSFMSRLALSTDNVCHGRVRLHMRFSCIALSFFL